MKNSPHLSEERLCDAVHDPQVLDRLVGADPERTILDPRSICVDGPPAQAFAPVAAIGGERGWYALDWLWNLRGDADRLLGGPGMRGRADPVQLRVGDVIDIWRVEAYRPDELLRLRCEMKMPGRAWLEFAVEPLNSGSLIRQTTIFERTSIFGWLYWWGLYPAHEFAFTGMLSSLARRAEVPWRSDKIPA